MYPTSSQIGNDYSPNYVENLTPLGKNMKTTLQKCAIVAGLMILSGVLIVLLLMKSQLMFLALPAIFGISYLGWFLWRFVSIEFEYSIAQGEMTMDVIYGARQRKQLFCFLIREMEIIAPATPEYTDKTKDPSIQKIIFAANRPDAPDTYFAICRGENNTRVLIYFECTKKALKVFQFYNPRGTVLSQGLTH